nr:unnamed protein product [Callosobruchus analis]
MQDTMEASGSGLHSGMLWSLHNYRKGICTVERRGKEGDHFSPIQRCPDVRLWCQPGHV